MHLGPILSLSQIGIGIVDIGFYQPTKVETAASCRSGDADLGHWELIRIDPLFLGVSLLSFFCSSSTTSLIYFTQKAFVLSNSCVKRLVPTLV